MNRFIRDLFRSAIIIGGVIVIILVLALLGWVANHFSGAIQWFQKNWLPLFVGAILALVFKAMGEPIVHKLTMKTRKEKSESEEK